MFFWTKPIGLKIFAQTFDQAKASKTLASNQGLYNGFLSAGLLWSLITNSPEHAERIKIFFLGCVTIAGIYGAWSVSKKVLLVQAAPAIVGLILIFLSRNT
jgi:putative membrane protein